MMIHQRTDLSLMQLLAASTGFRRRAFEMQRQAKFNTDCAGAAWNSVQVAHYIARSAALRQQAIALHHIADQYGHAAEGCLGLRGS